MIAVVGVVMLVVLATIVTIAIIVSPLSCHIICDFVVVGIAPKTVPPQFIIAVCSSLESRFK